MKRFVIVIGKEWITLWNGIKSFLGDKPLISAIAGIIGIYVVSHDPALGLSANTIQNAILVLAGLVVGTYKLVDIINAIANVYTAQAAKQSALAANTAALNANAAATTRLIAAQSIMAPLPSRKEPTFLSDVHEPQGTTPDPARTAPNTSVSGSVG